MTATGLEPTTTYFVNELNGWVFVYELSGCGFESSCSHLDKACFQHHIVAGDFKDSTRRTASDNILHDKAFNIAKNPKYDGYDRRLASMVYKFFDKKTSGSGNENENISNKRPLDLATWELAEELHKLVITKFNKRKVQSPFTDNIWGLI